ncbi:hypothetical protein IQ264_17885 [Phormidium sp. LEGE 05292]|uniref:hypothetical protein n=1 Tax=[Phormidium] sp. LEGE 05292 TaxID=767427 RepID=UPI00187F03D8|nr:hypothetical protein [Phormidium sp. LEGE 05292]MBE9227300.1 hypothetical protein [Phormidium sp. LEGE 05292]
MTENRLELLDSDLSTLLKKASVSQQRNAALVASQFAIERTSLNDPIVAQALKAIEIGNYGDESLREKIESLVNQLDEIQWDLQEKMDAGEAELSAYLGAFQQARSATSLYFALDADAFNAATESIYEADAATDDLVTLKQRILELFKQPSTPKRGRNRTRKVRLTGDALLQKVKKLSHLPPKRIAMRCGYYKIKNGVIRANLTDFYNALLQAKGVDLNKPV